MPTKGEKLHEGKSKQVYAVQGDDRHVILTYKDDATAFNGVKKDSVEDKGAINAAINWHLMNHVSKVTGVPNHLISEVDGTNHLCHKVEIVPVEVVVRNIVAGSCARRFGREEGEVLPFPMVEFFYKSDELNDPPISAVHARAFGWAHDWELAYFEHAALRVNAAMQAFWDALGVDLVDFKIEFGRTPEGHLLLADEISPDGCRLWEQGTGRKLDKDVFRRDLGDLSDTYRELYKRIFGRSL
ncbi:MAG: phosphoribosylaminoimidazolesuccinocarboxamide synthase [Myxococcota bacterium]|nr:phosphoribosylaminoimidazolesuccinocarboxamide synthase [Myxococcota bacterium]